MQDNVAAAMPMVTILAWILFIYTSCLAALLRWGILTSLLILLHAAFMRTLSEVRWSQQSGRRTLGWSLAEVYAGRPATGPGMCPPIQATLRRSRGSSATRQPAIATLTQNAAGSCCMSRPHVSADIAALWVHVQSSQNACAPWSQARHRTDDQLCFIKM